MTEPTPQNPIIEIAKVHSIIIGDTSRASLEGFAQAWIDYADTQTIPQGFADLSLFFYKQQGIEYNVYGLGLKDAQQQDRYTDPNGILQQLLNEVKHHRPMAVGWVLVGHGRDHKMVVIHTYRRGFESPSNVIKLTPPQKDATRKVETFLLTTEQVYQMLYQAIPACDPKITDSTLDDLIPPEQDTKKPKEKR